MVKGETNKGNPQMSRAVKAVITGTITGSIFCIMFVMLGTFAVVKMQTVPYGAVAPIAIAAACIGAFSGGYITARINKSMGMAVGAVCGTVIFAVFLGAGALTGSEFGTITILRLALTAVFGAFGGVLGVNKRKRRK